MRPAAGLVVLALAVLAVAWYLQADRSPTELVRDGLHGPVRTVALYTVADPDAAGAPTGARHLVRLERYDRAGNRTHRSEYDRNGQVRSRLDREFGDQGRLLAETAEQSGEFRREVLHYDADGTWERRERRDRSGALLQTRRVLSRAPIPLTQLAEQYAQRYDTGQWAKDATAQGTAVSGVLIGAGGETLARWRRVSAPGGREIEFSEQREDGASHTRIAVYRGDDLVRETRLVDGQLLESVFVSRREGEQIIRTRVTHGEDGAPLRRVVERYDGVVLRSRRSLENSGIAGWTEHFDYRDRDRHGNWRELVVRNAEGTVIERRLRRISYY